MLGSSAWIVSGMSRLPNIPLASAADAAHYLWSFNLRASIGKAWLA